MISLVIAQEIPSFQFNQEFDLKRSCSFEGFFCDSDFICNITLVYPDGTLLRDNVLMNDFVSYRNVTISQAENNQLGIIKAIQSCNNGTDAGLEVFDVSITADGKKFQVFPTQFVVIILAFLLIGAGFFQERLRLAKSGGSMLLMIMGVITIFPGYSFLNYSTLMGWGLGLTLVLLGFYFLIEDSFSREKQEKFFTKSESSEDLFK